MTNICCIGFCPFLMVAICGVLGLILNAQLLAVQPEFLNQYCSEANATNFETGETNGGFLIQPSVQFTASNGSTLRRYLYNVRPGSECVTWFSHDYPFSYPYAYGPTRYSCAATVNPEVCSLDPTFVPSFHFSPFPC